MLPHTLRTVACAAGVRPAQGGATSSSSSKEQPPPTTAMPPAPESDELVREEEEMNVAAEEEDETQAPPRGKGKGKAKAKAKARKRGAADDGGDDGEEAAAGARPAKKRHSEGSAASSEAGGGSVGSGSARDGEEDEEEEENDDMEDDAQYFNPRSAKNQTGQSAETGIIVKIYCENFMCHRKLSVTFCPNVNFINGQNGSGKSAILAALQICLGARANVTHRGSKLSDLIRQGHNGAAVVRVTLLNKGVDAFKPQAYGDFITVERKIERNGTGSYSLLKGNPHSDSPKFTTVSKSKEELVNMLDAFNIQIDNPCALLDQENAKRFIQGDAGEKYRFFEKATDIERVRRCIDATQDRLQHVGESLQIQEGQLPAAKETWKRLEALRLDMESLERIEEDINKARVEVAWLYYYNNVQETEIIASTLAKVEKQVKKLQNELEKAQEEAAQRLAASAGLETETAALNAQLEDARKTMKALKKDSAKLKADLRDKDAELKGKTEEIKHAITAKKHAAKRLGEERAKVASQAEVQIGPKVERVRAIEEELEGVEAELEQVERDYAALGEDRKRLKENDQRTRGEMGRLQHELKKHTEEKARLSKAEGQLAAYGDKMERLVNEIKRQAAKFSAPPLGPLGLHVKLKEDATQWAGPVENAIGAAIANFVVRSQKDRALLQDICHKLGCHWVTVITMKPSTTEYRVREPTARGIRSVAQCVSVEEPVVFNALVDWAKIDTSGVFRDHGEAMASCVRDRAGNSAFPFPIKTAYHLDNFQTELKNGNTVVRPCNDRRGGRKLGADKSQLIRDIDREIARCQDELGSKQRELQELQARVTQVEARMRQLMAEGKRLQGRARNLRGEKEELDEDISEAQAAASGASATQAGLFEDLQAEVEAADEEIAAAQEAQKAIKAEQQQLAEALAPLEAREKNEDKRTKALLKRIEDEEAKVEGILNEAQEAERMVKKLKKGLEKAEAEVKAKRKELEEAQKTDADNLGKVEDFTRKIYPDWDGEPRRSEKDINELKKEIHKMEKRKEREADKHATSDSVEVIREKEKRAKQAFYRMLRDINELDKTKKALEIALKRRHSKLKSLRKFIVRRAETCFDDVLQHRGQAGGLTFEHKEKELNLHVQKDARDESTQSNNVKELSGGERSFTTLALLLALGESIESPFRAMDEFDIFMDAVARKVALNKLIDTARSEQMRHRQFIFITPQDLSSVQKFVGDDFKIHKMRPPERSDRGLQQTTLN